MKNRRRYPHNWKQLAKRCKELAGWKCKHCGVSQFAQRLSRWTGNLYTVYLQAAHKHHDPENPEPELVCVCATCHWHHYRKPGTRPAWMIEKIKHQRLIAIAYCL